MNGTLPALLRLGNAPRSRFALATVLGALTVVFGVGPDGDGRLSDLPGRASTPRFFP